MTFQGLEGSELFDEPVGSEGKGEDQADPREGPVFEGEVTHPRAREEDGDPLPDPQAFSKEDDSQHNADEGIDEVPQARVDDIS